MCHFYLQCHTSHKHFDPWDIECLLSFLESLGPASFLTTFKLAWKTATLLVLVTAKHCSYLTLLFIDNQHHFLQYHAAIFIPISGGKTDWPGHLPPQIHMNLTPMLIFVLFFIWRLIWGMLNHLERSLMDHMLPLSFWVIVDSTGWSVLNPFLFG